MWRLFRQISLRQLQAIWGRTLLVVGGVATGVTLIVAIDIVNTSVLTSFRHTIDLVAGPAALQVTMGVGEVDFDESIAALVASDSGVAAAVPMVRGTVALADAPEEALQVFGVDLTEEDKLSRYTLTAATNRRDIVRILEDSHSVLITERLAQQLTLKPGSSLPLSTPSGIQDFTVRGMLAPEGLARAFAGRLLVMDLPAAQIVLDKVGRVDQIDLLLTDDVETDAVRERLGGVLPPGLQVERPAHRGRQYDRIFSSFQAMLTGLSTLCLVAGIFIVYNTTSTGAVYRAASLATLRHIGADRCLLFRLLLAEAVLLGGIGTSVGLVQGVVLAHLLSDMVTESMGVIFQLRFPMDGLDIEPARLAVIGFLGIGASLFASWFAARRITGLEPLHVLRADLSTMLSRPNTPRMVALWLLLVGASAAALAIQVEQKSAAWGNFGSTLWFGSSIIIAVPVVAWVGRWLTKTLPRVFGPAGRMAAESLFRSATRTGVTVAAIALVLTIAISVATIALSFRESVNAYFASGFLAAELTVSAVSTEGGWLETPVSSRLGAVIEEVPGVASVDMLRILPGQLFRDERIAIAGLSDGLVDPTRHPPNWYLEGDPTIAAESIRAGRGARISASLSDLFGLHVGDPLLLDSPTGPVRLEVAGVVPDYMSDKGGVGFSRRLLESRWEDESLNRVAVHLETDADPEEVRAGILAAAGDRYRLKILSLGELADYHERMINRAFAFTDAIQLLVIIVTVAGILDLLMSAILERRREMSVWRTIGADASIIRRSVVLESATIGILGGLLGLATGLGTAWIWVGVNFRYLLGYHLEFHFAWGATAWYFLLTLSMTVLAGQLAARQAAEQPVLEGLQND